MKQQNIFLLFGASGKLGKVASYFFLNHQYDYFYFFSRKKINLDSSKNNFENILTKDLIIEENVIEAFSKVKLNKRANYFLLSTIGAYYGGRTISQIEFSNWKDQLEVNLNIPFLIAKHFSRFVTEAQGGSICFISAQSSLIPESNRSAYNVSKNALNFLVKTLAIEGKEINLTANAVAPYVIESKENKKWIKDKTLMIKPEDICKVVLSIFKNYKVTTGNIIELPRTL